MNISTILQHLHEQQQYRSLQALPAAGGLLPGGVLSFCANDYLHLSQHSKVKQAAIQAIVHYGTSAASSRLLSGHLDIHEQLECELAKWSGCYDAALSFGSGYLANLSILQTVLEPGAAVFFDRFNHASLVDGLRLAQAGSLSLLKWQRYKHNDLQDLEYKLQILRQGYQGVIWLVTEAVFSMDGDIAPLAGIAQLAQKYTCHWIVDEAHSVGIFGYQGAGLVQNLARVLACRQLNAKLPDFVTANFAKALGGYGGFCLCSAEWKALLINRARSLIYSTGLPPASAAAALQALELVHRKCEESPAADSSLYTAAGLGQKILQNSIFFHSKVKQGLERAGFSPESYLPPAVSSPIIPFMLGSNAHALCIAGKLQHCGIFVKAIRSPTVPTARLRFSIGLGHNRSDLEYCAQQITRVMKTE